MRFNHVAIVGVGLIGGSFAMALRRAGLADRITGWGGKRSLEIALANGVIDARETAFDSRRHSDADLVYLSAPVFAIVDFIKTRAARVKPGAIVTDAGSTKMEICVAARESLPTEVDFVGGHPMAGSHRTGVEFATPDLFAGAPYALIRNDRTSALSEALIRLREVVVTFGARPVVLSPGEHDFGVARVSHAPQLVSTALAAAIGSPQSEAVARQLAGSGLLDMTRLAESDWSIWEDICRTNASEICDALSSVTAELEGMKKALASGDFESVARVFRRANEVAARVRGSRDETDQSESV